MDFDNNKPIYLQIAENMCEKIYTGVWNANDRIPSVRETAVIFGVNANTIVRSYEYLQANDIIYNKRGIGFFVTEKAYEFIENMNKEKFFTEKLPEVFKQMKLLNIGIDVILKKYNQYQEDEN